jgi:hypothetical protein
MEQLSALRTGIGTAAEIRTIKIGSKNSLYLESFHRTPGGRVQKITVREQFEPRTLKSFDPVPQELYRLSLQRFTRNTSKIAAENQP